jgi:RND family efflux transporter MFP subunit
MPSNTPRFALKLVLGAAILGAASLAAVYALRPVAKVVAVKRDKAINAVPGSIVVLAEYEMDLKGEFSGRIVRSELDPGKHVKQGDFLVQIDTSELQLQIEKTESDLETQKKKVAIGSQLEIDLENARDDLVAKERVFKLGSLSESDLIRQQREVKALGQRCDLEKVTNEQTLAGLENSLKTQRLQFARATIVAPFDGTVAQVNAHPGDIIGGGVPIAHLIATSRIVEAKISEENFADIKSGQKATVRFLTYGDRTYNATVTKILPTADPATQRYVVYLAVDIDLEKLVPGITGEAWITVGERDKALIVPRRAVMGHSLYVVSAGRVEMRRARLGYQGLNVVEILPDEQTGRTAVKEGELVIVEQLDQYRPGDRVRTETEN